MLQIYKFFLQKSGRSGFFVICHNFAEALLVFAAVLSNANKF